MPIDRSDVVLLVVDEVGRGHVARGAALVTHLSKRTMKNLLAAPRGISCLDVQELQADEIRTISGGKEQPIWIFATFDVWSRLWPSTVIGRRSYRNTLALIRDTASRMRLDRNLLIVTDGFEFYENVIRRVFGPLCLYGQVLKTRRNNRVVRVERRRVIGATSKFEQALSDSEDSVTLNTSFVERLNLENFLQNARSVKSPAHPREDPSWGPPRRSRSYQEPRLGCEFRLSRGPTSA